MVGADGSTCLSPCTGWRLCSRQSHIAMVVCQSVDRRLWLHSIHHQRLSVVDNTVTACTQLHCQSVTQAPQTVSAHRHADSQSHDGRCERQLRRGNCKTRLEWDFWRWYSCQLNIHGQHTHTHARTPAPNHKQQSRLVVFPMFFHVNCC